MTSSRKNPIPIMPVLNILNSFHQFELLREELFTFSSQCSSIDDDYSMVFAGTCNKSLKVVEQHVDKMFGCRWPKLYKRLSFFPAGDFPRINNKRQQVVFLSPPHRDEWESDQFAKWFHRFDNLFRDRPPRILQCFIGNQVKEWNEPISVSNTVKNGVTLQVFPFPVLEKFLDDENSVAFQFLAAMIFDSLWQGVPSDTLDRIFQKLKCEWERGISEVCSTLGDKPLRIATMDRLRRLWCARKRWQHIPGKVNEIKNIHCSLQSFKSRQHGDALAETLAGNLNAERFLDNSSRGVTEAEIFGGPAKTSRVAEEFRELLRRLKGFVEKVSKELKRKGFSEKARLFQAGVKNQLHGITFVVLGTFSSGKTTFLNSILELSGTELLPTGGKPVTATLNVLEYADSVEAEAWDIIPRKDFTLTFFGEREPQIYDSRRVHSEEIHAVLNWLQNKRIKQNSLVFYLGKDHSQPITQVDRRMLKDIDETNRNFINENELNYFVERYGGENGVPAAIEISEVKESPSLPRRSDWTSFFEWIKKPENALSTNFVILKRHLGALEGLRIVDTPGTDSCIAYHHSLAQRFIEQYREAPILLFIDSTQPAGLEDKRNIDFINKINKIHGRSQKDRNELAERLFIIVTKRDADGPIQTDTRTELLEKIGRLIDKVNWPRSQIHLIDSIAARKNPADDDWKRLLNAFHQYIDEHQLSYLKQIGKNHVYGFLAQEKAGAQTHLESLEKGAEERDRMAGQLELQASLVEKAFVDIEKELKLIRSGLMSADGMDFNEHLDEIIRQIDALGSDWGVWLEETAKQTMEGIAGLVGEAGVWDENLVERMKKNIKRLHSCSRLALEKIDSSVSIQQYTISTDFRPFITAAAISLAETPVERAGLSSLFSYTDDIRRRAGEISSHLQEQAKNAHEKIDAEIENAKNYYNAIFENLKATKLKEAKSLRKTDKEAEKEKEGFIEFVNFCEKWLLEYDSLMGCKQK